MADHNSKKQVTIAPWSFQKNIIGLIIFASLFVYCVYKLTTRQEPSVMLMAVIFALALFLTCIRIIRRLIAIRRILSAGQP